MRRALLLVLALAACSAPPHPYPDNDPPLVQKPGIINIGNRFHWEHVTGPDGQRCIALVRKQQYGGIISVALDCEWE